MKPDFNQTPKNISNQTAIPIHHFAIENGNIDMETVEAFGEEWTKFNHFNDIEITKIATEHYFDIVKEDWIKNKTVLDVGCGTGRWTKYVSNYASHVDAIDPSKAIYAAATLLKGTENVRLSQASVGAIPFDDDSNDCKRKKFN